MRDGWVETSLDDVFESCKNGKNYKEDENQNGLPITRIQTIADGTINLQKVGFGNLEEVDCLDFLLREGDILFSHINSLPHVGKVAFVTDEHLPLVHGMNLLRMRFKSSCDSKFMFYLMQHLDMREKVRSIAQIAVNQVSVNITNLRSLRILLPPLPEQRRIVDLISSVDSYIEALQHQLESAKRSRNAVLHELLTAGGDDWIETSLGEIAEVVGGGTPSTTIGEYWDGDIVWLTPTEITSQDGKVVSDSIRKITDLGFKNSGAQMLPKDSVILTSRASVGFVALAGKELCTNQGFQSLIPKPSVLSKFLMFWIQQNRPEFESRSAGSTFKEISKSNVKSIKLQLPPLPEQRRIVEIVNTIDEVISQTELTTSKAKNLRSGLLSDLLSGEHEIPNSYDKVMGAA